LGGLTPQTYVCVVGLNRIGQSLAISGTFPNRSDRQLSKIPVISIIDDDRSVRNATNRLVRSLGFIAYTFTSADEFLKSPYVTHTSCLIIDVRMPDMTGLELQTILLGKGLATPMIFITAFPEEGDRARALEAGAVDFLTKPFDGKTMIRSLSAALKGHMADTNEQYREP
jgi:FixJ family two-component response regulator